MDFVNHGLVVGVSKWTAPNGKTKGGKIYLLSENSGINSDIAGLEIITPNMPYDMYQQFSAKSLPAFYEILVSVERGAGGQDTEIVQSVKGAGDFDLNRVAALFGVEDTKGGASSPGPAAAPVPKPNVLTGLVVSASRYDMEEDGGQKGGSVYFVQPSSGRNPNFAGMEVFRAKIPYELFDQLAERGLPGEYELSARLTRRGGDKAALIVTGLLSGNQLTRQRLNMIFKPQSNDVQVQPSQSKPAAASA